MVIDMRSFLVLLVLAILSFSIQVHGSHQKNTDDEIVGTDECDLHGRPLVDNSNFKNLLRECRRETSECPEPYNIPIGCWNTEFVTDMSDAFYLEENFNEPIGKWNVSRVTTMEYMFYLTSFNQPVDSWDVGKVTNMDAMFAYASSFNQPLREWDVGNVRYMGGMFFNATSFNQPLEAWDVGKVTIMQWMFDGACAFNQPCNSNQTVEEWYPCGEASGTKSGCESYPMASGTSSPTSNMTDGSSPVNDKDKEPTLVPITTEDHDDYNSTGIVENNDDDEEMEDTVLPITEDDQTTYTSSEIVENDDEEQIKVNAENYVVGVASSSSTVSLVVSTAASFVIVQSRLML